MISYRSADILDRMKEAKPIVWEIRFHISISQRKIAFLSVMPETIDPKIWKSSHVERRNVLHDTIAEILETKGYEIEDNFGPWTKYIKVYDNGTGSAIINEMMLDVMEVSHEVSKKLGAPIVYTTTSLANQNIMFKVKL